MLDAITEAVTVGKEARMPVQLSHFKIDNRRLWGSSDQSLALVEKFRREGVDVVVDQYPYDQSSTNLGIRLPSWALVDGKLKERLADPGTRSKIAEEMKTILADLGQPDYSSPRWRASDQIRHTKANDFRDQRHEEPTGEGTQRN